MIDFIEKIFKDRLFILGSIFFCLFSVLIYKLYVLQIIDGQLASYKLSQSTVRPIPINAPRGEIFDKYGVPLAINTSTYVLKTDQNISLTNEELNETIYQVLLLLDENNLNAVYDLPISKTYPYEFTVGTTREIRFKKDIGMPTPSSLTTEEKDEYLLDISASECLEFLYTKFELNPTSTKESKQRIYPVEYKQRIAAIRYTIYLQRFSKLYPVPIAYDINDKIISKIEEESEFYPSIIIDIEQIRTYPLKEATSHMLGYTAKITNDEYDNFTKDGYDYTLNDFVGRSGLEEHFELDLRGTNGETLVEVTPFGKRMSTVSIEPSIRGNDLHLTVDSKLQQDTFEIIEETLKDVIVSKMLNKNSKETPITLTKFFESFVSANNIDYVELMDSQEGTTSYEIAKKITAYKETDIKKLEEDYKEELLTLEEYEKKVEKVTDKSVLTDLVSDNLINYYDLILLLYEQGIITLDENLVNQIQKRVSVITPLSIIIDKLETGEITPQMTNLDPSTASVVVVDVDSGDILTAVSYPSYDNNYFVNGIDYDYFQKVNFDPTNPIIYRAFSERRAPGSTFKMITAIAGLEEGYISPISEIYDSLIFTKANYPYARCWASASHGSINVSTALEVSCNYFFYELSYNMGNSSTGNTLNSIETLNKYMIAFGLNDRTGAEIKEYRDYVNTEYVISSPEYKEYLIKKQYAEPTTSQYRWYDGDTIRTAIGQFQNNYTPATMAKYIATLANGGTRYSLHFLDSIIDENGNTLEKYEPFVEEIVPMQDSTKDAVFKGMLSVTEGSRGTARAIFKDFPISVAGKTGTAQESTLRPDHQSFAGFAPYENPEIAIYVLVPHGTTSSMGSPSSIIAREVLNTYFGFDSVPTHSSDSNVFVQ